MPANATDLELLRRFEPVVRYTKGEPFYPIDIERYIEECSLWIHNPDGSEQQLVKQGELCVEKLVEIREDPFGTVQFLRFIEPLSLTESAQLLARQRRHKQDNENIFHAGVGRLARGGFLPRMADALFSLTLLLRGRVPAAVAAAAELNYHDLQQKDEKYIYYGRLVRQNGWTALQYWFLYAYNSWRSGFHGVNDHESDWEMVSVYLYEQDEMLIPEWVAYASHDFHGDDLRRRWNDHQQLDLEDGHPVVYAGAGSHASYFQRGEYQAEVSLTLPKWLSSASKAWNNFWRNTLGQSMRQESNPFRIPFVDYARGDGLSIGPDQIKEWSPVQISEETPWVSQYRGLWGLFARDPISGENAPAGPMYNRDGTPRNSWFDPLGYAGLDKVPPPPAELTLLEERCAALDQRKAELADKISKKASELHTMGIEAKAMQGNPHLAKAHMTLEKLVIATSDELKELRRQQSNNDLLLQSLTRRLNRLREGRQDDPRAHIRHLATPVSTSQLRFNRAAETWAAISLSLLLFGFVALIYFAPQFLWGGLALMLIVFVVIESILRGTFIQTVTTTTVILAVISSALLLIHYWRQIIVAGLIGMGVFLLLQKIQELRQ